jgi:hypothetical protein
VQGNLVSTGVPRNGFTIKNILKITKTYQSAFLEWEADLDAARYFALKECLFCSRLSNVVLSGRISSCFQHL